MVSDRLKGVGVFLIVVVTVSLLLSVIFSISSFSGYVTDNTVNTGTNILAIVFLLVGVVGAWYLLKRK
jgi:hypothetical protein